MDHRHAILFAHGSGVGSALGDTETASVPNELLLIGQTPAFRFGRVASARDGLKKDLHLDRLYQRLARWSKSESEDSYRRVKPDPTGGEKHFKSSRRDNRKSCSV